MRAEKIHKNYHRADFYKQPNRKANMSELQAAVEFQVELEKIINVDLFQRGYYQVRCSLKTSPKNFSKVEVSLPRKLGSVVSDIAVSKTFHILYRNEEISVDDVVVFKVYMLVDSQKILQSIEEADFKLAVDLWFTDEETGSDQIENFQCISQRTLNLHFNPTRGLHQHVPVMFDYFHLAVVCVTINGMLLALQQPYINLYRQQPKSMMSSKNQSTMEAVLFGNSNFPHINNHYAMNPRLQQACYIHTHICSILLAAYDSLQSHITEMNSQLPEESQISIGNVDCHKKLIDLRNSAQTQDNEEELFQLIQTSIAQVCAQNVILWSQYIDCVTLNNNVAKLLARDHHLKRVHRFSEAFYSQCRTKQQMIACYEPSTHGHSDLASLIRNSVYLQSIPPLQVECAELDGDCNSIPIIFEDIYCEPSAFDQFQGSHQSASRNTDTNLTVDSVPCPDSSPQNQRVHRKKIPKNLKIDTLRRPSSMYAAEISNQVALEASSCTLVGYRKIESEMAPAAPLMELGTLSPMTSHNIVETGLGHNVLYSAISLPTLMLRDHASISSSGSLPELSMSDNADILCPSINELSDNRSVNQRLDNFLLSKDKNQYSAENLEEITNNCKSGNSFEEEFSELQGITKETNIEIDPVSSLSTSERTNWNSHSKDPGISSGISSESDEAEDGPIENGFFQISSSSFDISSESSSRQIDGEDSALNCPVAYSQDRKQIPECTATGNEIFHSDDATPHCSGDTEKCNSIVDECVKETSVTNNVSQASDSSTFQSSRHISENPMEITEYTALELLKKEFELSQSKNMMDDQPNTNIDQKMEHTPRNESPGTSFGEDPDVVGHKRVASHNRSTPTLMAYSHKDVSHPTNRTVSISASLPELSSLEEDRNKKLVSALPDKTSGFKAAKESLRNQLIFNGHWCSDILEHASKEPYFCSCDSSKGRKNDGIHLIICVHGLDGNSADLRLVRTYLELALPGEKLDFLMSEKNQVNTFADFEVMTVNLVDEIFYHLEVYGLDPTRISFVGHSLGNLVIRSAIAHPKMTALLPKLYTFLSLSGPHLGTLYNSSGLVNMGMWFMQKWKKSGSLLQLSLKDHHDPRQTFLYKLSQKTGLEFFKNILLVGSHQDRYVPYHSSRIELCRAAVRDSSGTGGVYAEMVNNILQPIVFKSDINFLRYDVFHALPSNANTMIGRAAHIAVLDSELFIEKLLTVSVLNYFK